MTEIRPQTIRLQITQDGGRFFTGDVQVYPWHIANYGGDWTLWLENVAPEWVDRTAGGIRAETFQATAADLGSGEQLADVEFVHTTTEPVAVTVDNQASKQLDELFQRLGPPATGK